MNITKEGVSGKCNKMFTSLVTQSLASNCLWCGLLQFATCSLDWFPRQFACHTTQMSKLLTSFGSDMFDLAIPLNLIFIVYVSIKVII